MQRLALFFISSAILVACVVKSEPPVQTPAPQPGPAQAGPPQPAPAVESTQSEACGEADCAESEYCAIEGMGCESPTRTCKPKPEMCTREFRPVCGCDGKTYSNACAAAAAGQNIEKLGECLSEAAASCGGITGALCPAGTTCVDDPRDSCDPKAKGADCIGMCVEASTNPVCEPVRCRMYCKNSWKRGPDGCEICACK